MAGKPKGQPKKVRKGMASGPSGKAGGKKKMPKEGYANY